MQGGQKVEWKVNQEQEFEQLRQGANKEVEQEKQQKVEPGEQKVDQEVEQKLDQQVTQHKGSQEVKQEVVHEMNQIKSCWPPVKEELWGRRSAGGKEYRKLEQEAKQ